jgi:hypothetical protein
MNNIRDKKTICDLVISFLFLSFGLGIVICGVIYSQKPRQIMWPYTNGDIIEFTMTGSDSAYVHIKYSVGGKPYQKFQKLLAVGEIDETDLEMLSEKYPKGSKIKVFYNPRSPESSKIELQKSKPHRPLAFVIILVGVFFLSFGGYLFYRISIGKQALYTKKTKPITSPPSNLSAPVVSQLTRGLRRSGTVVSMVVEMLQRGILTLVVKEVGLSFFKIKNEFILTKSAESNRPWENLLLRKIYQPIKLSDNLLKDLNDDISSAIGNYYDRKGFSREKGKDQWSAFKDYLISSKAYAKVSNSDQFDSYLPYAIALGCSAEWIRKARQNREIALPRWLDVPDIHDATKTSVFLLDVNTVGVLLGLLESIARAFGYIPQTYYHPTD